MTVGDGERRALIGPNGAGKTTLFNAICGTVRTSEGRVTFARRDVTSATPHRRARLGMCRTFQITNLFPSLTVAENMELALRGVTARKFSFFGSAALSADEKLAAERALSLARLTSRADWAVKTLSYGEQRQLELAMALAQ
ncbi:MAG: ATP-binding cassette domain-containing protein, partial [Candidatus Binataceae bacterium]